MGSHSDALDKRLRAVYDAFDQRNHKGAIKLCNAGLQKYPDCHTFRSLKAVALDRTGKRDEALQLVYEVLAAAPPDDHVLNMLLLVLKPANKAHELTAAYEAAVSKQPSNEELLQGLFACHVRAFSYTAAQQVAMKLNKLHPSELYQWWVVVTLALQAHAAAVQAQLKHAASSPATTTTSSSSSGGDGKQTAATGASAAAAAAPAGAPLLGSDKLLALAEAMAGRLLAKAPAGGGNHSWEAVMMYLGLLQAQGKHDVALSAVRGPLGASLPLAAERREAEAALLLSQGQLAAAAELYRQALQEQPDDWAVLLLYLDCVLPATASTRPACASTAVAQIVTGVEASTRPGCQIGGVAALLAEMSVQDNSSHAAAVQDRFAEAEALINSLAQTEPANNSSGSDSGSSRPAALLRGPALARVELAKRKLQLGLADEQQLLEGLLQYHDRFGHVVSCAMDVFCYLELLSSSSRQQLGAELAQRVKQAAADLQHLQQQGSGSDADSAKQQLRLLRRQMSARQIQADIGVPALPDPEAAAQHAQQLMQLYAAALPLYQGLDERERGPADELLWQAAAALVTASTQSHASASTSSNNSSSSSGSSSSSIKYLLQAMLVLEAAAKGRPYCAPVRLGLTGLHALLGDAAGAARHFTVMDVKHVQHDTLTSHHLLPLLLGLGATQQAEALLQPMCALFEDHLVDAGDTLMQAYKNGTYTQVLEFVCFKERLERSHNFKLAQAERAALRIRTAAVSGPPGAAAEAVAAAVTALPLSQLGSCDWQGMRFNDDLTTRLPWLPPIEGPRQLVVLLWWEQQRRQCGEASGAAVGACWWRQVAAAEADVPAAAALRASMKAAVQQRWLLPHMLQSALDAFGSSSSGSSSSGGASAVPLSELLPQLAAAMGCSSVPGLQRAVDEAFGSSSSASTKYVPLSMQLQLLNAALFTLASSLQEQHAQPPKEGHANGHVSAASAAPHMQHASLLAAGLSSLQRYLHEHLQPATAYQGCVLPGDVLSAAALLVSETCCWVLLCLEAWSKALKHAKKKKGSSKAQGSTSPVAADQHSHLQADAAAQALGQMQEALQAVLQEVQSGAQRFLQVPVSAAAVNLLADFDDSSVAALKTLVGWEPQLSVQLTLTQLVTQQHALLAQLKDSSHKLCSKLHSVVF